MSPHLPATITPLAAGACGCHLQYRNAEATLLAGAQLRHDLGTTNRDQDPSQTCPPNCAPWPQELLATLRLVEGEGPCGIGTALAPILSTFSAGKQAAFFPGKSNHAQSTFQNPPTHPKRGEHLGEQLS